jgi:diguanylate cyclase (GGDEF)-like protein
MLLQASAHVLVVDDDPHMHEVMGCALATRGHVAHAATSLAQAGRQLASRSFDMLLIDSHLPDGRGETFLEAAHPAHRDTPIIFVSAYCRSPSIGRELRRMGASDVVCKPFAPVELLSRIDDLLRMTASARELTRELPAVDAQRVSSPPIETHALRAQFEQLRKRYATKLPGKMEEISRRLAEARTATDPTEALTEARTLAHRLRGTAGSYGFPRCGRAAGQLEDLLQSVLRGQAELHQIAPQLEELTRLFQSAVSADTAQPSTESETRAPPPAAGQTGSEGAETAQQPANAERSVLLLSRDEVFRDRLAGAAGGSLLKLTSFDSAEAMLERARRSPVAAAVLDVDCSYDQSMVDIARRLRSITGLAGLPLAFVSSDGDLSARVAATNAGASLFITKPSAEQELLDALRQLTSARDLQHARLLLIDDDPEFSEGLAALLRSEQIDLHVLHDPTRVVETLERVRPDLLLLDLVLPTVNGLELCRIIRTTPRWQMLPVLMLTSLASQDARLAAFEAGTDDYLLKPIVKQELLARVRLRIDHARLVHERSTRDSLTEVLTRRAFVEGFASRLAAVSREGGNLSLCLFDLDNFKQINDAHGHLAGDRVLAGVGRVLRSRFRECDLRGRWGGEEFIAAFPGVTGQAASEILIRLLRETREMVFVGDNGEPFRATFSAGISTYPDDGTSLEQLIRVADQRLYRAKELGRDRIVAPDTVHDAA